MTKILVADDNSNIQKMVGLALKDQGIDVVAVGNGEAAVRKIADILPDLVLADVFMPVRNGYEVCEFVKNDHRLAHIPVILLVGAFDPLDEHEAQRVGADGVLKKPFVPPDPLISMVKSTLARVAADLHASVAAGSIAAEQITSPAPSATMAPPPVFVSPVESASGSGTEAAVEEMPVRPLPVSFDAAHQPLAFGSLLETPTAPAEDKEEDSDLSFLPATHPELTDERSWRSPGEQEEEEELEEKQLWRRDVPEEIFEALPTEEPEREGSAAVAEVTPILEELEPADVSSAEPAAVESSEVYSPAPTQEAVESPELPAQAAAPLEEFAPENYPGLYVEEKPVLAESAPELTQEPQVEQEVVPPAVVAGKWEEEVRRAAQLANAWDIGSSTVPSEEPATTEFPPPTMDPQMPTTEPEPFEPSPPAPFEPPLPEPQVSEPAWADMTAAPVQTEHAPAWHRQLQSAAAEVKAEQPTPVGRLEKAPEAVPPFSPDMEAIIAKVLAKMNPEVLQQVSREILKPVIEALLRDEIGKKS